MSKVISLKAKDGAAVEFVPDVIGQGGMKDVYFSPDRSYVVAFFRDRVDHNGQDRLNQITGLYRERIFNQPGGDYWSNVYCWPQRVVEWEGRTGIVAPTYRECFFFQYGSKNNDFLGIKGKEKEGKWFASASNQNKYLDPRERGNWLSYVRICLLISRAVKRLHAAGLAHSDLSYKNVLVDPVSGNACIIDLDGLVVPDKYPPDVIGTPDFIAPEVIATGSLNKNDRTRKLPSILTDRHALAVLIYMYLLYRHPLRGGKVHDADPARDEELSMGLKALFVENAQDASNRIKLTQVKSSELPWGDTSKLPYTLTGPYLSPLFLKAFTEGLHSPQARPTADEWEQALVKTVDLAQPCPRADCEQKWYVFDNSTKPKCPFCGTPYRGMLPILNLYSSRRAGTFQPDNHRLMIYHNQSFFSWHINRNIFPGEKLSAVERRRVGYFVFHHGQWHLVNERMPDLRDISADKPVPPGSSIALAEAQRLLLSKEDGGRMAVVQMVSS